MYMFTHVNVYTYIRAALALVSCPLMELMDSTIALVSLLLACRCICVSIVSIIMADYVSMIS